MHLIKVIVMVMAVCLYSFDIDTTVNKRSVVPYVALSAILPGSGQIAAGSALKGGAILALQTALVASAYSDGIYLVENIEEKMADIDKKLGGDFSASRKIYHKGKLAPADSVDLLSDADAYEASRKYYTAIGLRTFAFAAGLYLTNIADSWRTIRPSVIYDERSPSRAFLLSALPGLGHAYNGKIVKTGMTLTALMGLGVNIYEWNKLGNYHESRSRELDKNVSDIDDLISSLPQNDSLSADRSRLKNNADSELRLASRYFSRRNENIWYAVAIYLFSAFDAVVDAHLAGFDKKIEFSFTPEYNGGARLALCIPVKP